MVSLVVAKRTASAMKENDDKLTNITCNSVAMKSIVPFLKNDAKD